MYRGINHIAIVVKNLEAALQLYHGALGLPLGKQATVADQGVKAALLPVGGDEVELLEPTNPAGGVAKFLEKKGEGIHHLCVETEDIAGAIERAKALNLQLIDQVPRQGLAGTIGFMHPAACHGVLVELAQPGEGEHHAAGGGNGIQAQRVTTIYAAVKELPAAAAAFARNFDGTAAAPSTDPSFETTCCVVTIGSSSLTLFGTAELGATPAGSRVLAGRGDGVFGFRLGVADAARARQHLQARGVPCETVGPASAPLGWIAAAQAHGVNLFF
jgi:methylmalonyl-CoA/ethylmalonyl-CoA epimerase